jgi:hypothetical protein
MPDGRIHVGLVGFGASFTEAIKIFHSLLVPPTEEHPYFHTARSRTPVHFTLLEPYLNRFFGTNPIDLMEFFASVLEPDPRYEHLKSADAKSQEMEQKNAFRSRVRQLCRHGQLDCVPARLIWESVALIDGVVEGNATDRGRHMYSCVVDCAPFIEGIGEQHKRVLEEIPDLSFAQIGGKEWRAELRTESSKSQIGLVGAAFCPRDTWDAAMIYDHSMKTVQQLFPAAVLSGEGV